MAFDKCKDFYARNAGADLSAKQYFLAHVDADGDIVLAGDGEPVLGSIYEPAAENSPVTVGLGPIIKAIAGATIDEGENVASNGSGEAVPATTGEYTIGIALSPAGAGEYVSIARATGYVP